MDSPTETRLPRLTFWPEKGAVRRLVVCAVVALSAYLVVASLGGPVVARGWQLGWHLYHRNRLRLSRAEYTVPMRWFVEGSDSTGALLVDLPPRVRRRTTIFIDASGPPVDVNKRLQLEQRYWKSDFGEIQRTYRLQSSVGEFVCLESTSHVIPGAYASECWNASGDWAMLVGDRARLADYHAILASARPVAKP